MWRPGPERIWDWSRGLSSPTRGVKRDVVYEYAAVYPDPARLTAGVRLEMGIRGEPEL